MVKVMRGRCRFSHELKSSPYDKPSSSMRAVGREEKLKKVRSALEKKGWEDATCPVCLELPHNAVLLLCSSYENGCLPYMCGTSYRHSNCLDQFQKAYINATQAKSLLDNPALGWPAYRDSTVIKLACPLCRGQVKGYTVVEPAREYLNTKKRSCMHDKCSFVGTYRELCRHLRKVHPHSKPRNVDPSLEQKWRVLVNQRERADLISTIRSSMPGSLVLGDYLIDLDSSDSEGGGDGSGSELTNYILHLLRSWFLRVQRYVLGALEGQELGGAPTYLSGGFDENHDNSGNGSNDSILYDLRPERPQHRRRRGGIRGVSVSGAR